MVIVTLGTYRRYPSTLAVSLPRRADVDRHAQSRQRCDSVGVQHTRAWSTKVRGGRSLKLVGAYGESPHRRTAAAHAAPASREAVGLSEWAAL